MHQPSFIERTRQLPYAGQITVSLGDWVEPEQLVGRIDYLPGAMRRVDVAQALRIKGNQLQTHMRLAEGDAVLAGEALAVSSCFGERRSANSPYQGYVGLISRVLGQVYVREPIPVGGAEPLVLDVAAELQVGVLRLRDCWRVREGSIVSPGQVIAQRRSGVTSQIIQSSVYGRVTGISQGQITISPLHVRTDLNAYLAGHVVQIEPGQSVTIRAYAHHLSGQYGVGGETGGNLLVVGRPDAPLATDSITPEWNNQVVLGGWTAGLPELQAAAAMETRALILGHLSLDTLLQYVGESKAVGLTGDEDVPMTVVLLDGFLPTQMSERSWDCLRALAGRHASVNGTTHIRAGVIRPEIVVCERSWPRSQVGEQVTTTFLGCGAQVRVLRAPFIGEIGVVVDLPAKRQRIATGAEVRVARVRLRQGTDFMPISNLELLPAESSDQARLTTKEQGGEVDG